MKILLDENLPKKLKKELAEHEVWTVREKGWNGKKNGELMRLMQEDNVDVFITFDKNLQYQQNFEKYTFTVILLNALNNSFDYLQPLMPQLRTRLHQSLSAEVIIIRPL
jgi:predicted nuclease of predicted toxin-antitoxin system